MTKPPARVLTGVVTFVLAVLLLGVAASAAAAADEEGGIVGQLLGAVTRTASNVTGQDLAPASSAQPSPSPSAGQSPDSSAAPADGTGSSSDGASDVGGPGDTGATEASGASPETKSTDRASAISLVGEVSRRVTHERARRLPAVPQQPSASGPPSGATRIVSGVVTHVVSTVRGSGASSILHRALLPVNELAVPRQGPGLTGSLPGIVAEPLGFLGQLVQDRQGVLGGTIERISTPLGPVANDLPSPSSSASFETTSDGTAPAQSVSLVSTAAPGSSSVGGGVDFHPGPQPRPPHRQRSAVDSGARALLLEAYATASATRTPSSSPSHSSPSSPSPTAPHGPGQGGISTIAAAAACGVGIALALAWLLAAWSPPLTRRRRPHAEIWRASAFELLLERPG